MCSKSIYFKKMFWFPPHASLPWIGFLRGLAFRPWNALYEGLMKRRASQSAQVASGNWVGAMLSGACKMEDQRLTDQRLVTSGMRVRRIQHTSRRARPELSDCAMEWLCLQTMLPDSWLIPVFCLGADVFIESVSRWASEYCPCSPFFWQFYLHDALKMYFRQKYKDQTKPRDFLANYSICDLRT